MEHLSNSKELFRALVDSISLPEPKEEIESIVFMLLKKRCGLSRENILAQKEVNITLGELMDDVRRINSHEPVQYILGVADFFGREFVVDPSVLIPRPETEILVVEALKFIREQSRIQRVLDVGTGSGCIAITLAIEAPCEIVAIDISKGALGIAENNANSLGAEVTFKHHDVLRDPITGTWDVIVSNPPYVRLAEAGQMKPNVTAHEPGVALFVPDDDPLIFYKALEATGRAALGTGGAIFAELNENLGPGTQQVFSSGYDTTLIKDLNGKHRVLRAIRREG